MREIDQLSRWRIKGISQHRTKKFFGENHLIFLICSSSWCLNDYSPRGIIIMSPLKSRTIFFFDVLLLSSIICCTVLEYHRRRLRRDNVAYLCARIICANFKEIACYSYGCRRGLSADYSCSTYLFRRGMQHGHRHLARSWHGRRKLGLLLHGKPQ